ncbi:MAG: segregation/condensation protein A [Candidatus Neomarinimicrobiota bacterium]
MYKVNLEQFQGPLDLLLYFIRQDEIDIYDIPITKITAKYLQTMKDMESLNISLAGEFILMAATLMGIKSRMLLPNKEINDEGEIIDPRSELVLRLLEYQRFQEAADSLNGLAREQSYYHPRTISTDAKMDGDYPNLYFKKISLYDLSTLFKNAMDRRPVITTYELEAEQVSLDESKILIFKSFDGEGNLSFSSLLKKCRNKLEIIITFLAVLELIRLNEIRIYQRSLFSDLGIHRLDKN